jgi:hypothetical protein
MTEKRETAPLPGLAAITNPVVRSAIGALIGRDKKRWFELFSESPSSLTTAYLATS